MLVFQKHPLSSEAFHPIWYETEFGSLNMSNVSFSRGISRYQFPELDSLCEQEL